MTRFVNSLLPKQKVVLAEFLFPEDLRVIHLNKPGTRQPVINELVIVYEDMYEFVSYWMSVMYFDVQNRLLHINPDQVDKSATTTKYQKEFFKLVGITADYNDVINAKTDIKVMTTKTA